MLYNIKKGKGPSNAVRKSTLSPELESFPSLAPNLLAASISSVAASAASAKAKETATANAKERDVENTLVVAADDSGTLYLFLRGSYSLGQVETAQRGNITSIFRANSTTSPLFFHSRRKTSPATSHHPILASFLSLPTLTSPTLYNVAKVSTTVRSLLTYLTRVLDDMQKAWFGTDSLEGGRDVGRKWIKVLEEKERLLEGCKTVSPHVQKSPY